MKKIFIAGSTGSIGKSTVEVASAYPENIKVTAISAAHYSEILLEQAIKLKPKYCFIPDKNEASNAEAHFKKNCINTLIFYEEKNLKEIIDSEDVDIVLNSISGSSGLLASYYTILAGKDIALANKESLVTAGDILTKLSKKTNSKIIPVDSEHSAIFQCLRCGVKKDLKKLILTASGGPFLNTEHKNLSGVTKEMALNHPKWKMGEKITIDSSTLANKGLEIIEAHYLFDVEEDKIDVVIHPQAVIHSMVEFHDGTILAQLADADMKGPIGYALSYPERLNGLMKSINLAKIGSIEFLEPDLQKFPFISIAREALKIKKSMPCVFSEANEFFVKKFLKGNIKFTEIAEKVKKVMEKHISFEMDNIEDVLEAKRIAKELASKVG
ncbi:MAG: 1-deoxy-D-xylulose-5-phosphate reductoisomerase [Candidatus Acididesulfobacter diazotrophicus]|jgi:1-deoxy-D-xylulose-5-phosphate reductoisomerase|uniref:1-deoxy-D-xylulose 5-phosphate reductoisomerase n=1 Tax=Candidatus Acididesulfobacter diazotrophicus TaxID=2597226 RepID=A0A519BPI9_9DELT|nr:MAG: 1-deoxy-D-xylulose-5-phosphate reductoisomerase [Candidatus Acididesulfobacter diazotrophicus]